MKISEIDVSVIREALSAAIASYGAKPDDTVVCVVTETTELRHILAATAAGMIDARYAPIPEHPRLAWALEARLYEWSSITPTITSRTVRAPWDSGGHVTELRLELPALSVDIRGSDDDPEGSRGLREFVAEVLAQRRPQDAASREARSARLARS